MAVYASLVLLAPGPTNTLLFASGLIVGVKNTLPLIAAEVLGYAVAIGIWGFLLAEITKNHSWTLMIVKLVCCCALLMVAVKLWKYSPEKVKGDGRVISAQSLFLATLANPKALLFAGVIFPSVAFDSLSDFVLAVSMFSAVLVPISIAWSTAGQYLATQGSRHMSIGHVTKVLSALLTFGASMLFAALVLQKT